MDEEPTSLVCCDVAVFLRITTVTIHFLLLAGQQKLCTTTHMALTAINPCLTAAENVGYTEWLLLLLFSAHADTMSELQKEIVSLSETAVRMGHSCSSLLLEKLEPPDISYDLSQGRYLIHCLTYLMTCHRGGISFTA